MALEKLLTPLKINPLSLTSISIGSFLMCDHLTSPSNDLLTRLFQVVSGISLTAPFLSFYSYSVTNYFFHKKKLKQFGFRKNYAIKAVQQHCSRQPFYLVCKQQGYLKEFNEVYEKEKNNIEFPFIPLI